MDTASGLLDERRHQEEVRLAELILEQGFVTGDQIHRAQQAQAAEGFRLEEALHEVGALTLEQVELLQGRLGWRLVSCPACQFEHTINEVPPGNYICGCGTILGLDGAGSLQVVQAAGQLQRVPTGRSRSSLRGRGPVVESFLVLSSAIERGIIQVAEARDLVQSAGMGPQVVQELARLKSLSGQEVMALCQLAQSDQVLRPEAAQRACDGLSTVLEAPGLLKQLETMTQSMADCAVGGRLPHLPVDRDRLVTERLIAEGYLRHVDRQVCLRLQEEDRADDRSLPLYHYALQAGRINGRQLQQVLEEIRVEFNLPQLEISSKPADMQLNQTTVVVRDDASKVADYTVMDRLGGGGMGTVYLVEDGQGRQLALKTLKAGEEATERQIKRFETEAEAMRRLDHPGIIRIHDTGIWRGIHYFTMDYVDGPTLSHLLVARLLSRESSMELLAQVLDALEHAHQADILHRDLKPSNILVDSEGRPRLTDFGLAKRLDESQRMTRTGDAVGTPYYMSPEQAAGNQTLIGPRSDTFSCGVLMYQMLTGQLPFNGQTTMELYYRIAECNPLPPSSLDDKISADLDRICLKALARELPDRYVTAASFADDLRRFLAGKRPRARLPGVFTHGLRYLDQVRLRSWVLITLMICLFTGVGYLSWQTLQRAEAARERDRANVRRGALVLCAEGLDLLVESDPDKAAFRFRQAHQLDPSSLEPEIGRALLALEQGNPADAEWHVRRVLAFSDRFPSAHYVLGRLAVIREEHQAAILAFSVALDQWPRYVEAYRYRAVACEALGQVENARLDRARADEIARRRTVGWLERGQRLMTDGNSREATRIARRCLVLWPECDGASYLLGQIAQREDQPQRALQYLQGAVRQAPTNPNYHLARGRVLRSVGEYSQAIDSFRAAAGLQPRGAGPFELLDMALSMVDLTRARAALREAAPEHDPVRYHALKGRWLFFLQRSKQALAEADAALRLDRNYLPAMLLRARLVAEAGGDLGPVTQALTSRLAGLDVDQRVEVQRVLGRLAMHQLDWPRARKAFQAVLDSGRRMPQVLAWLGEVLYHQRRFGPARLLLDEAIELRPAATDFLVTRGNVFLALEQWDSAESDFERVGRLDSGSPERVIGLYQTYLGQLDAERILGFLPQVQLALEKPQFPGFFLDRNPLVVSRDRRYEPDVSLAAVGAAARFDGLLKSLGSKSVEVHDSAISGLSAYGQAGLDRLITVRDRTQGKLRKVYASALGEVRDRVQRKQESAEVAMLTRALIGRDQHALREVNRSSPERVEVLVRILRSSAYNPRIRRLAAEGLIAGRTRSGVSVLQEALTHQDPVVRIYAGDALASADLWIPLALYRDAARKLRGEDLAFAVLRIRAAGSEKELAGYLAATDDRVALAAAIRLAASQSTPALTVLLRLSRSPDVALLEAAVLALKHYSQLDKKHASMKRKVRDQLLELTSHPNVRVARAAVWSLDDKQLWSTAVNTRLVQLARKADDRVQIDALLALGRRRSRQLREVALARLFDDEENPLVRAVSLHLLASLKDPQVLLAMPRLLKERSKLIRTVVILAIGGYGIRMPQIVVPILTQQLNSGQPLVCTVAAMAMSQYRGPAVEQALSAKLDDPVAMVRGASAGSLTFVQLAGGKPSKILEKVEAGSDPALRRGASIALARLVVLRWAKKRSNTAEGRTQLLDWLDRAIRLYPPELSYVRLRRQLREAHGDLTGALKDARKILGIQGSTLQDQAELGRLAERAGEQKQARTSFEAYLAAGGREESVLLRLASIQEAGGATAEALKSYDRASLLAPRSARASTGKARCQLYLGQLTAAERTLVEARRLVGVDVRLVVEEARLAQLSRRTKAAVAKLEEAMRLGLGRKALREILLQRGLSSLRGHPVVRKLLGGT